MSQYRDEHRILFIDQQASFDLAAAALGEGHTWEALRDALQRALDCAGRPAEFVALPDHGVRLA